MKRANSSYFPPISLEADRTIPLHRQIYGWFRKAILGGQLRPGQRVPSTRSLAADLHVSRAPVLSAFEQLHAEGYLETRTGAGTQVTTALNERVVKPANSKIQRTEARSPRRLAHPSTTLIWKPEDRWLQHVGAFRIGLPDIDHFPVGVWSSLLSRHARRPSVESMIYGTAMGYMPLREAIAEYLRTVRAVQCEAQQIMIVNGAQHGLQIAARVLLGEGDAVWMEDPGYQGARSAFLSVGANLVPVPVDTKGLNVAEGIRRKPDASAVYVTPSHQYPTGFTMTVGRRMQLLEWAARSGAWILEDDYDGEYRFAGQPIASVQSLDVNARVIYVGTFSKILFPGLRIGYIVVPTDLIPAFLAARQAIDIFSPVLYQMALTDFIREGHFARHIRRMKKLYMTRREVLIQAIHELIGENLKIVGAVTGMHLLGLLPPAVRDIEVSNALAEAGISVAPLSACYLKHPDKSGLIMGYATADSEQIREGVTRLAEILNKKNAHTLVT